MTSDAILPMEGDAGRTALEPAMLAEFRQRILENPDWLRLTLVRHQGGASGRESLRPVLIREATCWQAERAQAGRTTVRNLETREALAEELERLLLATGPREYHLQAPAGDLHVRVTRKGRLLVSRGRPQPRQAPLTPPPHDRVKRQPLAQVDAAALLRVTGIGDRAGNIRASMRGKYDQINAFLRELEAALPRKERTRPLEIVDCGSGGAYLTLAAYFYLRQVHGLTVHVRGIDRNEALVQKANGLARDLDAAEDVSFMAADLAVCTLDVRPDLLLSLHACDDATDAALARGVEWGVETMLVAPCCQHNLQTQIRDTGPMRALLRHGMLRERQADLLTDAFRAQILRLLGYRVKIVEFVSSEVTARNLLLRAVAGLAKGQGGVVEEYLNLREFWQVTPLLETMLAPRLAPWLGLSEADAPASTPVLEGVRETARRTRR
jgi:SAM-dependent methyltransferase